MTQKKAVQSLNTWDAVLTSVVGIVGAVMSTQGIDLGLSPDEITTGLQEKTGVALIMFILFKLSTPAIKVYKRMKEGGFDWAKLKSRNLFAQVISLVCVLIAIFVKDAEAAGFICAAVVQIGNFVWHTVERNTITPE